MRGAERCEDHAKLLVALGKVENPAIVVLRHPSSVEQGPRRPGNGILPRLRHNADLDELFAHELVEPQESGKHELATFFAATHAKKLADAPLQRLLIAHVAIRVHHVKQARDEYVLVAVRGRVKKRLDSAHVDARQHRRNANDGPRQRLRQLDRRKHDVNTGIVERVAVARRELRDHLKMREFLRKRPRQERDRPDTRAADENCAHGAVDRRPLAQPLERGAHVQDHERDLIVDRAQSILPLRGEHRPGTRLEELGETLADIRQELALRLEAQPLPRQQRADVHAETIDELRVEIEVAARLLGGNGEQRVQDALRRTRTDHAGRIRAHARRSGEHGSQGFDLAREVLALRLGPDGSKQRLESAALIRRHLVKAAG